MGSNVQAFAETKEVQNNATVNLQVEGQDISVKVNKIDENNVKVTTVTDEGETHEVTYNRYDDYMIMDGRKVPVKLTQEVDESKVSNNTSDLRRGVLSTRSTYTPVYMCTNTITFSDMVATVSAVVSLIAAAITFSIIAITTEGIKTAVEKSLSASSVALIGASFLDGYVKYDQYRTSGKVSTSTYDQYMYRTQNYKFGGVLSGVNLVRTTISGGPGSWYFASKPY